MEMIRIAILGIAGLLLALTVREVRPEYAMYISLAVTVIIMLLAVGKLGTLFDVMKEIEQALPVDTSYLHSLLKMIGITYVGQFASGLCRDAGFSSIAGQIEIFCRLAVLVLCMPVLVALMDMIRGFLV